MRTGIKQYLQNKEQIRQNISVYLLCSLTSNSDILSCLIQYHSSEVLIISYQNAYSHAVSNNYILQKSNRCYIEVNNNEYLGN
jgi:hypothetical protein